MCKESIKIKIIDMAASIIGDDIQTQVYNRSKYPSIDNTGDGRLVVPNSLNRFLHGEIKSKGTKKKMQNVVAHPQIMLSSLHVGQDHSFNRFFSSVYIHQIYGSQKLREHSKLHGLLSQLQGSTATAFFNHFKRQLSYNLDGFPSLCLITPISMLSPLPDTIHFIQWVAFIA